MTLPFLLRILLQQNTALLSVCQSVRGAWHLNSFDYLWHENHISSESISSRFTTLITLTTWTSDDWTGAPWLQQHSISNFFLDTLYYLTFALETYFLFVSEYRQVVVWAEYYNIVEKTNSPTAPDTIYVEDVRPQYLPTLCCITFGSPADNTLYAEVRINSHK